MHALSSLGLAAYRQYVDNNIVLKQFKQINQKETKLKIQTVWLLAWHSAEKLNWGTFENKCIFVAVSRT